jgi:sugar phosphate isomerase/epimerase
MKVGCIPICFLGELSEGKRPVEGWIAMAARVGLDGIEVYKPFVRPMTEARLTELVGLIRQAGLEVSMFTSYANFVAGEREKEVESVKRDVDWAVICGAQAVRLTAGGPLGSLSAEEGAQRTAEGLRACLDYAEQRGVSLALEDHAPFGDRLADFLRILELVDDSRLKVNLDTSNPLRVGDDPVALTRAVSDRVVHLHVSDVSPQMAHLPSGEGIVDLHAIFTLLKQRGYDGWLSSEAGGPPTEESIARSSANIRRLWREAG